MTISPDLFQAILAMDAYNRGYDPGLAVSGAQLGDASLGMDSAVLVSAEGQRLDQPASFFAQAYTLSDGQKIISYRGTDSFLSDPIYGWPLAGGVYWASQAQLAAQFFQKVVGNGDSSNLSLSDLYNANILLTGHSLGGGLAGFIGSIYGQLTDGFDAMAFASAAPNLFANLPNDSDARNLFFLGGDPTAIYDAGVQTFSVQGQALSTISGLWTGAPSTATPYDLGFSGILTDYQRHNQALLVIRMYADQTPGVGTDWLGASRYVLPDLFNDTLAEKLGLVSGNATGTGSDTASGKMRTMIAYSAIDVGAMIYGNSGIRALYDDANELGRLIAASGTAVYLKDPGVLKAISDIIVEYAGLLANNKDIVSGATNGNTGHEKGALYYDESGSRLIGDFSRGLWQVTDGPNKKFSARRALALVCRPHYAMSGVRNLLEHIQSRYNCIHKTYNCRLIVKDFPYSV